MLNGISNVSSQNATRILEQQVTLPEFRKTSDCLNNIFSEIKIDHILMLTVNWLKIVSVIILKAVNSQVFAVVTRMTAKLTLFQSH